MDSSPGFGSAALDWDRPIQTRFRFGSLYAKPRQAPATRWPVMQKVRRHKSEDLLRPLVGVWFQVLFHSPCGVLFTFPSRYWFAIGHR